MSLSSAKALLFVVGSALAFAPGAPQYWPQFSGSRNVSVLDGTWEFGFIDGGPTWSTPPGFDSMGDIDPKDVATPNKTAVPGCMDVVHGGAAGYLGPRGVGFFRTTFEVAEGMAARLQFQSCSFYCRVFVNGVDVGDHRNGGYVAFWLDVPSDALHAAGPNELFVVADNRFNSTTAPMHTGGDFWHYGGLTRSVELHQTPATSKPVVWRAYVTPTGAAVEAPYATPEAVDLDVVFTDASFSGEVNLTLAFDGAAPVTHPATAKNGRAAVGAVEVPNPALWSLAEPNLHTVAVSTGAGGEVTERFGLRKFGVEDARVTINGEKVKLVGWNHHTQYPVTAASPTDDQIDADVALLQKGAANYVRGAHYPHDPRFLDRLDEAGIAFWSETLGPGVSLENTQDWDDFMPTQLEQLAQMLDNALNHASILTWGFFNEGPSSDAAACPGYAACANASRARDPTRFVTWADDNDATGVCYASATLISLNDYPGWYNHPNNASAGLLWNGLVQQVMEGTTASGAGTLGKPFTISETGAGGIFEWDDNGTSMAQWTLNYQTAVIETDVDVALSNENVSGITLWHFTDFKVDNCGTDWPCNNGPGQENNTHCTWDHAPLPTFEELDAVGPPNCTAIVVDNRPGGANHKGSVDFWRREKPVFGVVAAKYAAANA
mmetsp:Transcript_17243/g.51472  ORF Transcript_17243/g.51472 Transcript_17243/m.51472 type:complete len:663 (-) Transcript_17243:22-2010(-)